MSVNKPQNPNNVLLTCPLLSANSEYNKMCVQDRCAWFIKSARTCSVAIIGHESLSRIKVNQEQSAKPQAPKPKA